MFLLRGEDLLIDYKMGFGMENENFATIKVIGIGGGGL